MKNFVNVKMVCAIALCLSLLITLCSCGDTSPSSSESDSAAQTTSSEKQNEASSEATVTSDTSVDKEDETPSKSSKPSSVANNNISSKPIKPSTTTSTVSTTSTTATTPTPKTPAQLILGKWRGSADIAPLLAEQGYAVEGEQLVSCDMEFASGGVLYATIDRESLKKAYTNIFTSVLNAELEKNNLTKEEFEANAGKTFDEYLNELVQFGMQIVPKTSISAYKFVGNDLYVRDQNDEDFEKEEYSFSGENKLTILDGGTHITYTRISKHE